MAHEAAWMSSNEQPPVVLRLARRLRPRDGYLIWLLAWTAVVTLPLAVLISGLTAGLDPLPWLATLSLALAWWLAGRRLNGWVAGGLLTLSGTIAVLLWGVHVLRLWPLLSQSARWLVWWAGAHFGSAPPVTAFAAQADGLIRFGQRVGWWVGGLATGQGTPDNLVTIALACAVGWLVAAWAGWWLARHARVFLALLPTGALLLLQVYWTSSNYSLVLVFLAAATLLLVLAPLARQMRAWDCSGTDYSPEIRIDAGMTALQVAGLVLVLSPLLPFLTSRQVSDGFWRIFRGPYQRFEERVNRSFEPVAGARSLVPPEGVAPGGLPRAHLLGGRPELGQEVALRVRVRGASQEQALRWRGQTFARYTGQGWEEDSPRLIQTDLAAGEPWAADQGMAPQRPVLAVVTVASGSRSVVYAAGEPVSVDRPYRVLLRAPGELVAMQTRRSANTYGVLSAMPAWDAAALRRAGTQYSPAIAALYLELPGDLPAELRTYAAEITGGESSPTPYDKALAIEAALRNLPYSLDVPAPPPGREVVSWFLFDLRRGYCDYFATAMVVLARLSGVPARLAVGYVAGNYDERSGQYIVTELNAHSWPELFFPGYGWAPFEPTPSQSLRSSPVILGGGPSVQAGPEAPDLSAGLEELRASAVARAAAERTQGWLRGLLAFTNAALAAWLAAAWARQARSARFPDTPPTVASEFGELASWGARLGRPLQPGDTLREYAVALASVAAETASCARLSPSSATFAAGLVQRDLPLLAGALEAATYSPEDVPTAPPFARRWHHLWAAFRRVWLARWHL